MTGKDCLGEDRKIRFLISLISYLIIFVLSSAFVLSVGYAPLGVYGRVVEGATPISSATVWLKAYFEGEEIAVSERVFSNDEGFFYALLTIPDGLVVDVSVTVLHNELFVEVIKDAHGWNDYFITYDFSSTSFSNPAETLRDHLNKGDSSNLGGFSSSTSSTNPDSLRPSPLVYDVDLSRIENGDALKDSHLIDEYGIIVEDYSSNDNGLNVNNEKFHNFDNEKDNEMGNLSLPFEEKPFYPFKDEFGSADVEFPFYKDLSWQIFFIVIIIVCVLVIRYEFKHHKLKHVK